MPISAANVFQSTVVIGMSTRSANTYTFTNVTVPTGAVGLSFTMDLSEATEPLPIITANLEGSRDGGAIWGPAGAFTLTTGRKPVLLGVTRQSVGASFMGGDFWSDTTNVNRRLRGSASIGGTMRFAVAVQPL